MELNDHNCRFEKPPEGILVKTPPAHQGVADALRSVFTPVNHHLPEDMRQLIEQIR